MPVERLNHAVLYVADARRSAQFYIDVLDFEIASEFGDGQGVFLRCRDTRNDHDLALFTVGDRPAPPRSVGLYHLAWQVPTLGELAEYRRRLVDAGALVGQSDHTVSKSLYAKDLDGIEFEVMWAVPPERVPTETDLAAIQPLDLEAELAVHGQDTPGRTL